MSKNKTIQDNARTLRLHANIGLWGSVALVVATAILTMIGLRGHPSQNAYRWMLIVGAVLSVLDVSMALLVIRREIPIIRQTEGLAKKIEAYATHIRTIYMNMLAVVASTCTLSIIAGASLLIALAMIDTLVLFMAYPNMYKVKIDLGLDDNQMQELYGDKYVPANE